MGSEEYYIKLEEVRDTTEIKLLKVKYKIFRVFRKFRKPGWEWYASTDRDETDYSRLAPEKH